MDRENFSVWSWFRQGPAITGLPACFARWQVVRAGRQQTVWVDGSVNSVGTPLSSTAQPDQRPARHPAGIGEGKGRSSQCTVALTAPPVDFCW
jgi:hypothetical protein